MLHTPQRRHGWRWEEVQEEGYVAPQGFMLMCGPKTAQLPWAKLSFNKIKKFLKRCKQKEVLPCPLDLKIPEPSGKMKSFLLEKPILSLSLPAP